MIIGGTLFWYQVLKFFLNIAYVFTLLFWSFYYEKNFWYGNGGNGFIGFEKENPNVKVVFNFGSSGELAEGTRKNLFENEFVLIVPNDSDKNISNFESMTAENIQHISLGEPKGVPVE